MQINATKEVKSIEKVIICVKQVNDLTYDSSCNLLFSKVVWRGHLGATAKSATASIDKESVSHKREFSEFGPRKFNGGFLPLLYNFKSYTRIYKLLFKWMNSYLKIAIIIRYRQQLFSKGVFFNRNMMTLSSR